MELKFRAWDYQSMLYNVYPTSEYDKVYDAKNQILRKVDEDVMQYIGITDRQGNPVYTGDIFEHSYSTSIYRWIVMFKDGCFGVRNICNNPIPDFHPINSEYFFEDRILVGNKFENPELLIV